MIDAYKRIASVALALPAEARAELVGQLLDSLDEGETVVSAAWEAEIERRVDQVERGETKLIPGDALMSQLRSR